MNQMQATITNLANAAAVVALVGGNNTSSSINPNSGSVLNDQNSANNLILNHISKNQNFDIQLSEGKILTRITLSNLV